MKSYLLDHLNSPVVLFNRTGTVNERYEYDAYGACNIMDVAYVTKSFSSLGSNPILFTGRNVDYLDGGSLKLQYNRNRYYSQDMGRWLTKDPLGTNPSGQGNNPFKINSQYSNGMNLYEYVNDNPMIYVDEFGLSKCNGASFALVGWKSCPLGSSPSSSSKNRGMADAVSKAATISSVATCSQDTVGAAWSIATDSAPMAYYDAMVNLNMSWCGSSLYALICKWNCIDGESELNRCTWVKCPDKSGCGQPDRKKCESDLNHYYFNEGYQFHWFENSDAFWPWGDLNKIGRKYMK